MIRTISRPALYLGGLALAAAWLALSLLRMPGPHAPSVHPAAAWSAGLFALPGVLAMFPCLAQMSMVFSAVVAGVDAGRTPRQVAWRSAQLLLGYTAVYAVAGAAIGLTGQAAVQWLPGLKIIGGLFLLLLGIYMSRLLSRQQTSHCRGSLGLLLRLPPNGQPAAAGVAFAIYCAGCCGPYLYGAAFLAGALGSAWQGAGTAVLFALGTLVPMILPAVAGGFARQALNRLAPASQSLARFNGYLLMAAGALILLDAALLPALLHQSVQGGMHH